MNLGGRKNTFDVNEMLALRKAGWTLPRLALAYSVDHSTILYHCQKHDVKPETNVRIGIEPKERLPKVTKFEVPTVRERPVKVEPTPDLPPKYAHLLDTHENKGKSYKEYLKDAKARPRGALRPWIKNYMGFTPSKKEKGRPVPISFKGRRPREAILAIDEEPYTSDF